LIRWCEFFKCFHVRPFAHHSALRLFFWETAACFGTRRRQEIWGLHSLLLDIDKTALFADAAEKSVGRVVCRRSDNMQKAADSCTVARSDEGETCSWLHQPPKHSHKQQQKLHFVKIKPMLVFAPDFWSVKISNCCSSQIKFEIVHQGSKNIFDYCIH
jgi:hypothetical protein